MHKSIISDTSLLHYVSSDKVVWLDNDDEHIVKSKEYSFRTLEFPKIDEMCDATFAKGGYENGTPKPEGNFYISSTISVHDNVTYIANLPFETIGGEVYPKIVCRDTNNRTLSVFTTSPILMPNHTTNVIILFTYFSFHRSKIQPHTTPLLM